MQYFKQYNVSSSAVARLIGKKGSTINKIRQDSQACVDVDVPKGAPKGTVYVSSKELSLFEKACELVDELIGRRLDDTEKKEDTLPVKEESADRFIPGRSTSSKPRGSQNNKISSMITPEVMERTPSSSTLENDNKPTTTSWQTVQPSKKTSKQPDSGANNPVDGITLTPTNYDALAEKTKKKKKKKKAGSESNADA